MKKVLLMLLFLFISTSSYNADTPPCQHNVVEVEDDTSFLQEESINDSILYLALVHYEVKHPKKVLAQAKLESGNYTSRLYVKGNNFLGLYDSRKGKYFHFGHWTDCILAYKDMVEYKLRDGEDYYKFLKRIGYAEDASYVNKVRKIERTLVL